MLAFVFTTLALTVLPPEAEVAVEQPEPSAAEQRRSRREDRRAVVDAKRIERLKRSLSQRTLASHPFVQPQFIASALPTTHLGLGLGGAGVRVHGSDPQTGAARRSTYFAGLGRLDGGLRFGKWFGLAARLDGIAGVGGTPNAALDYGAALGFGWSTRAFVRVLQLDATALSIGPHVFGSDARALLLQPGFEYLLGRIDEYVDYVTQGGDIEDLAIEPGELQAVAAQSVRRLRSVGGGAQVGLAQAFGRFVGLQVGLELGGRTQRLQFDDGRPHDLRSSTGRLRTGAALSLDAGWIPLAALVEYDADMSFAGRDGFSVRHQTGLGLVLNGLTHTIGLLAAAEFAANQITLGGQLSFRAYF